MRPVWQRQSKERAERFLLLFGLIEHDQELAPALQRQSREGAERDFWSFWGMVCRKRTSLEMHHFYNLDKKKNKTLYISKL